MSIDRDRGRPFATVMVQPSARLERNREVLLVWPAQPARDSDSATTHTGVHE